MTQGFPRAGAPTATHAVIACTSFGISTGQRPISLAVAVVVVGLPALGMQWRTGWSELHGAARV